MDYKKYILLVFAICLALPIASAFDWTTGVVNYWTMDQSNGSLTYTSVTGAKNISLFETPTLRAGKISNSILFNGSQHGNITAPSWGGVNASISFWVNFTGAGVQRLVGQQGDTKDIINDVGGENLVCRFNNATNSQFKLTYTGLGAGYWNFIVCTATQNGNMSLWINNTLVNQTTFWGAIQDNNNVRTAFGKYWDSNIQYLEGELDEIAFYNKSLSATDINELWNSGNGLSFNQNSLVTLNSPADATEFSSFESILFNASITSSNLNLTNATLYLWYSNSSLVSKTNKSYTGTSNESIFNITGFFIDRNYVWNVLACNTNNTCGFANTNFTFSTKSFSLVSNYSIPNTFETTRQYFELNISTNPSVLSLTANLYYNGSKYASTVSAIDSSNYNIKNDLDLPTVNINSYNFNYFWEVITTTSSQLVYTNTTTFSQNVNKTFLVYCNASINTQFINFTIYDALSQNNAVNASFYSNWNYWLGNGVTKANYSSQNSSGSTNTYKFCISPSNYQYKTNTDIRFNNTNYANNYHYFRNATFNTNLTEQKLFLLGLNYSTLTTINIINDLQQGLPDRLVYIQLYDVGTNSYNLVSMAKTNFEGSDIAYLNWYDSFYKFVIVENGEIVSIIDPSKISSTPLTFKISDDSLFAQDKFGQVSWNMYFNNVTNNIVLTFTDGSGKITSGCLKVAKVGATNYTIVSNQCSSSSSATLSYNIAENGTYFATFYATGSFFNFGSLQVVKGYIDNVYSKLGNLDATSLAIITVGTSAFLGLIFGAVAAVFMLIMGFVLAMALGFINTTFMISFISFAVVGGYLMWKLRT